MKKRNLHLLFLLFITAITLITYSNHFNNGFHFDDSHTIQDNVHIRNIKNIPEFFSNPQMFSSSPTHWGLRPVVTTSLAIDYWMGGGLNPFYFHLSTFIVYLILCCLLFFIFRKIINKSSSHKWNDYFALYAVALFALNTVNAETINYIISRSDVLSTFFIVISFAIYVFYPKLRRTYIYIIPALIGAMAKETVLVLPIFLFFYILLFEKNIPLVNIFNKKGFKTAFLVFVSMLPLIIAIAALQFYNLSKAPGLGSNLPHPYVNYWLTQSFVWVHYFLAFFFPFNLSADADWGVIMNFFDTRILVGLIFVFLLIYTIFKTSVKKEHRPVSFGLIWFAVSLLPTSVAPLAEVMNDHRMFFAFIGLSFAIVYTVILYLKKHEKKILSNKRNMALVATASILILFAYAYGTYQRNKVWKDSESLWYDVTIKSPKNGRGLMNYGLTQMSKGKYDIALDYFNRALVFTPYYSYLHIILGVVKNAMGNTMEAEESFLNALRYGENLHLSHYYYANFLLQQNRLNDALLYAEKALNLSPAYLQTRHLLMGIYSKLNYFDKLNVLIQETLKIYPADPQTLNYNSIDYSNQPTALEVAEQVAAKRPTPENYLNLSLQYYNAQKYQECIDACYKALELKPDYDNAYNNICSAYNALGEWDKAIAACDKAIEINPDYQLAKNNRNWAISQKTK